MFTVYGNNLYVDLIDGTINIMFTLMLFFLNCNEIQSIYFASNLYLLFVYFVDFLVFQIYNDHCPMS